MPKQSETPQEKPTDHEKEDWKLLVNTLHKHLPQFFPSVEEGQDPTSVKLRSDMEHALLQDQDGEWKFAPTQRGIVTVAHQYKILHKFLQNFSGNPKIPFEFAGFHFIFRIDLFVEKYLPHVSRSQMREVLRALRINKNTIDDDLKGKLAGKSVLDKVERFIKDFEAYVRKEENARKSRFPFGEIIANLGVTEEELIDLEDVSEVDKAGILIQLDARQILYEPHLLTNRRG